MNINAILWLIAGTMITFICTGCNLTSSVDDPALYLIPGARESIEAEDEAAFKELTKYEANKTNNYHQLGNNMEDKELKQ